MERLEAATDFHRTCVQAADNALASTVINSLFTSIQRLHHLNQAVESHFDSQSERIAHEGILAAITEKDSQRAQQLMHDHLVESNDAIARSFLAKRPLSA